MNTIYNTHGTAFKIKDECILLNNVLFPKSIDSDVAYNPHNVRAWAIGDELGISCIVWASNEQAALHDALQRIDELETQIGDTETLNDWNKKNGPADSYKAFFYDCFERLSAHYPCPEVTSDYDCGVIFDAIERGEEVRGKA